MLLVASAIATFSAEWPTALGSGEISGSVVAASTGGPIRGAGVYLTSGDEPGRATETDDQGRFVFERLPPGRYHLSAKQPGFLDVTFGQKRPGSGAPGVAIRLADGQRLQRVVLTMPRGGAISGVISDPYGDPAFGASVTVLRYEWTSGERTLAARETVVTDERGMYRVPVLPPGDYVVRAAAPETTHGGSLNLADVYHPGVASLGAASVVTLGLSEERTGVDVALQRIPTYRVTGAVVDANSRPPSRPLLIALDDGTQGAASGGTHGAFAFPGLAPGTYSIRVLVGSGVHAGVMDEAGLTSDDRTDGPALWAQADVTVVDRDIADVRVMLQPGRSVSGRVAMDGGARALDLSKVRVRVVPAGATSISMPLPRVPTDAQGHFSIAGIPPGRYRFTVDGAGAGLTLRSALVGGRDALDFPFEVEPGGDVAGAVLTVSDRTTDLSGTLSDAAGQPTSDYMVVVFAADPRYWTPTSRRIVAMRPSSDGRYAFRDLPAGEYRLAALTDAEPGQWFDPRVLHELVGASIPARLTDGERHTQDVRVR